MAKKLLNSKGIAFDETDVTFDRDKFSEMVQRADGRRTVPQIFIHDEPIGGFTELAGLARSGTLENLLNK